MYPANLAGAPWRLDFLLLPFLVSRQEKEVSRQEKEVSRTLFSSLDGRKEAKEDQGAKGRRPSWPGTCEGGAKGEWGSRPYLPDLSTFAAAANGQGVQVHIEALF